MLTLARALRMKNTHSLAFVGAGGKTTALFQLARELAPALLCATTHLGDWQVGQADRHLAWESGQPAPGIPGQGITLVTGPREPGGDRFRGLDAGQMEYLRQFAGFHDLPLLIEADGSRQKPLKAPAEHEPAIPPFVETVVVVAGLGGLDQPLGPQSVHRAEIFAELGGLETGQPVSAESLARVLSHPQGGLKNIPPQARKIALLNQADDELRLARAGNMARSLLGSFDAVLAASLRDGKVFAAQERIAGIVLAAGAASRYGQPKQLLDYHGEPFARRAAQTALAAGLDPVIVVTGAHAEAVEAALQGLPVHITRNQAWSQGQSASIRAGLQGLEAGGAVFLLADQPQVTRHVLDALKSRHAEGLFPIVAPLIADRRGNPALFDRQTFPELRTLQGDVGGRAIFRNHPVEYLPWHDESLLFDVDSEDDYRKLLAWGVEE
jgi:molybdenum cofactor cytidylyltransferase